MRFLIIEPLQAVGESLCRSLDSQPYTQVGTVRNVGEALPQISSRKCDLLLVTTAAAPNLAALAGLSEKLTADMRWGLLDDSLDFVRANYAVEHGLAGYLTKEQPLDELRIALATICRGERSFAPRVQERLIFHGSRLELAFIESSPSSTTTTALTTRETQVLILIAKGYSVRECAAALGLSHSTVDNHKSRLMAKLNIHKSVELAHYALRQGLITLDDIKSSRPVDSADEEQR